MLIESGTQKASVVLCKLFDPMIKSSDSDGSGCSIFDAWLCTLPTLGSSRTLQELVTTKIDANGVERDRIM